MLLMLIALLTAGLFLATLRTGVVAAAADRVGAVARRARSPAGFVYPALVQSLVVNPNQQSREAPYIDRNVAGHPGGDGHHTDDVDVADGRVRPLDADDVEADLEPLRNVRLLNPSEMLLALPHRPGPARPG